MDLDGYPGKVTLAKVRAVVLVRGSASFLKGHQDKIGCCGERYCGGMTYPDFGASGINRLFIAHAKSYHVADIVRHTKVSLVISSSIASHCAAIELDRRQAHRMCY